MKQFFIIVLSLLVFTACSSSSMTEVPSDEGILDCSAVSPEACIESSTSVMPGIRMATHMATRTVSADLQIDIYTAEGTTPIHTFAPGESSRRLSLPEGDYELRTYTLNYDTDYTNDELGAPKYEAATTFRIESAKVTKVALSVPMTNVAITFTLPEGIETAFPTHSFTVKNSDESRAIVLQNDEIGYFDCPTNGQLTLLYTLSMSNLDGEQFERLGTLTDAMAGTQYSIDYRLETLKR